MISIEIGSGNYPRFIEEGYLHSDIRFNLPHQELCFDIKNLPFKENSVDAFAVVHCLEHLGWRLEVEPALKELYRAIKPNGHIYVIAPNLLYIANLIIELEDNGLMDKWWDIMQDIYCIQDMPENFHKSGFTPNAISEIMTRVGFRDIAVIPHTKMECAVHVRGYK